MFKLAHISDVHLGPLPKPTIRELMSKRITGYLNWKRARKSSHSPDILNGLLADLKTRQPDHIAVTGDLVNLSLDREFENATQFLNELEAPEHVTVICGNHDAYVPGALQKALNCWRPFIAADQENEVTAGSFPILRKLGDIAIISCNSAEATLPFMATGYFREDQAQKLSHILRKSEGMCRIVLIHHPPIAGSTQGYKRLIGSERFQRVIAETGAELVLHGHTHLATCMWTDGPAGKVPVICVPAASNAPGGHKPAARYNLFSISKVGDGWKIVMEEFGFGDSADKIELIATHELS